MKRLTTALAGLALAALTTALPAAPPAATPPAAADMTGGWIGRTALAFTLPSIHGVPTDLSKVLGIKPVVLIF